MGIEIIPDGNGKYTMKFRWPKTGFKGYTHVARNLVEVHNALDHHFTKGANPQDHANSKVEDCPLCRSQREKEEKDAKDAAKLTFTNVEKAATAKGLVFWNRVEKEKGKVVQRYALSGNGTEMGLMTLAEAMQEIRDWTSDEGLTPMVG